MTGSGRRLGQTDPSRGGPVQKTAKCSHGAEMWRCWKGGHKTESCAGGEGKGNTWGLTWEQGASLEQEIAPKRTDNGDPPPRDEWRQKMGTEEGAKELRVAAEEKTGKCPICK